MVKTNKKSIVALVAMALLLVASIVMAATGAWFHDSAESTGSGVWGNVSVDDSWTITVSEKALPGDEIIAAGTTVEYTGDVEAWYRVEYEIEGLADVTTSYGSVSSTNKDIALAEIVIPANTEYSDTVVAGGDVSVKVTVTVLQKANLTATEAAAAFTEAGV